MFHQTPDSRSQTVAAKRANQAFRIWQSHAFILTLFAVQYLVWQLLTMPLPGDSPRNLHWGLLTAEQPGFLLNTPDTYERIKGFPPHSEALSVRRLYANPPGTLHRWWGPVVPLILAAVWSITHSYTVLRLIIPLAGAGAVLLTYTLARSWFAPRVALIAAAFLAFFPLFHDFASTAYSEAFSACILTAALLAYARERTFLAIILGALAMLSKLDLVLLYGGVVGSCILYAWLAGERYSKLLQHIAALIGPVILASPWIWMHYLRGGSGAPTKGVSLELFGIIAPQMLQLLFYIPWYGALITLAAIGLCVFVAIRTAVMSRFALVLLGSWLGLGLLITLVYAATPGAGNSPRIFLPALPPLALLLPPVLHNLEVYGDDGLQSIWLVSSPL